MTGFEQRLPTVDEFRAIAESVDWLDHFDWASIGRSLEASLHSVVAVDDGRAVAVGRVVGDGVRYFYVQDVMVDPQHEGEGIATAITAQLVDWVRSVAAPKAFVGLFASPDAEGVYEELGFTREDATGMHLTIEG
jgi:GNAT superfamily N-acetyltransferase